MKQTDPAQTMARVRDVLEGKRRRLPKKRHMAHTIMLLGGLSGSLLQGLERLGIVVAPLGDGKYCGRVRCIIEMGEPQITFSEQGMQIEMRGRGIDMHLHGISDLDVFVEVAVRIIAGLRTNTITLEQARTAALAFASTQGLADLSDVVESSDEAPPAAARSGDVAQAAQEAEARVAKVARESASDREPDATGKPPAWFVIAFQGEGPKERGSSDLAPPAEDAPKPQPKRRVVTNRRRR